MDLWAAVLRQFGIPSLNFALLGRWVGHLPKRSWRHESIAKATPVKGELVLGWLAHCSIGISFAGLLLATFGLSWARSPSLPPALFIGVVTKARENFGRGAVLEHDLDLRKNAPRAR